MYTLKNLVVSLKPEDNCEVILVNDDNYFLFSPLLHAVAAGGIETRHIAIPIRRFKFNNKFHFIQGDIKVIDLEKRSLIINNRIVEYDYLVIALGSVTNTKQIEALNKEERTVFTLKSLHDTMLIRNHIIKVFEMATMVTDVDDIRRLLTFVICGGGYTGVQIACELRDFIYKHLLKVYKLIDPKLINIVIIERTSQIIADLHPKLSLYAQKKIQQLGIQIRFESQITAFWADKIEINGKDIILSDTLIWVAGVVSSPTVSEMNAQKDNLGRILVDNYLAVSSSSGVYALGDCAYFANPMTGTAIPPRAHNAVRQAKVVAHNILADIRGKTRKTYNYSNSGEVVFLGASNALFRFLGLRLYGFPAYIIGLLGYSLLFPGTYNRIRIIADWFLYIIFGRDTTLLRQVK